MKNSKRAFTLIELVIAVLIIGILAAVAVPMYQRAVLKSKYSTLMPVAKSIASAEEIYFLNQGNYANSIAQLDVASLESDSNAQVSVSQAGDRADGFDYVFANRSDTPGVAYIIYQDRSGQFPGAVMCEDNDELNSNATWLCQKSLNGQDMGGSLQGEGWNAYLLSGSNVGRFGSAADEIRKACNQTEGCSATVDKETGEVTTTQCDTGKKWNLITTYADDGTQTGYRRESCYGGGNFSNCICLPQSTGFYMDVSGEDESGKFYDRYECTALDDESSCKAYYITHLDGDTYQEKERQKAVCSTAWDGKEGTCSSFESGFEETLNRRAGSTTTMGSFTHYECGTFNADGSCKTYKVNSNTATPNIKTMFKPDGSPVYGSSSNPDRGYFYVANCTSFSGTTCQSWQTQLRYGDFWVVGTAQTSWKTCTTLDPNTGGCP